MAAIVFVLAPFLMVLAIGSIVQKILARKMNFWQLYRYAFTSAAIWTMLGNYGLWYGKSQQACSTSFTLPAVATPGKRDHSQMSADSSTIRARVHSALPPHAAG